MLQLIEPEIAGMNANSRIQPDFFQAKTDVTGDGRRQLRGRRMFLVGTYTATLVLFASSTVLFFDDFAPLGILVTVWLLPSGIFFAGAGLRDLCQPISPCRLLVPTLFMSLPVGALLWTLGTIALESLYSVLRFDWPECRIFYFMPTAVSICVISSWLFCTVLLFVLASRWARFTVLVRSMLILAGGNLAALPLNALASFALEGYSDSAYDDIHETWMYIVGATMAWLPGPVLVLLFLRPLYLAERALELVHCTECGCDLRGSIVSGRSTCPDCRTAIPTEHVNHPLLSKTILRG